MKKILALLHAVSKGAGTLAQKMTRAKKERTRQTVTRQRLWQLKQRALGLCEQCSCPAAEGVTLCHKHLLSKRLSARNTYREKHGTVAVYKERASTKVYKPRRGL
tara:strand:+ start:705 stop:1019 length:315 start_codon:yes stop_codon:yes gene_type:complete